MTDNTKLESLAFRLNDLESLRMLFAELNYEFADEPVYKKDWNQSLKDTVVDSRIIAKKHDFLIYYIKTESNSIRDWKNVATKIISSNNGFCLVCSHNPAGFQWIFSSLSKEFSKSFSQTRHIPIEIKPNLGVPKPFLEFLESIQIADSDMGITILGKISDAFDKFSLQIHDELTVNVFEAFKSLSEGIIGDKNNNFELNDESLKDIRSPTFILLYRIIFVLYAEDRGIFPVENKIYNEEFSLKWIKQNWLLKPETTTKLNEYTILNRLKKLFHLIEVGSELLEFSPDEFFMRSYYGRLFDRKINSKLEKWQIPNKQLLDALRLITGTRDTKGNYFFLDYSALEIRHLGSVYEHLLEYHLSVEQKKIAQLPNLNDRKASGSYYTPKEIVDYIVKSTIEPQIQKIIKKNPNLNDQIEEILSLKVLDPAMGSGHFLVSAVEYLASRLCEIEHENILEQNYIERKRDVVRRCIYGVDLNSLAVDLAKLSLWLETLSSEKPLSFLSAHLKQGNSLLGESIENIFDPQQTLFETKSRSHLRKAVQDFLGFERMEDDTPSAVKSKIEKYQKMHGRNSFYHKLLGLLDNIIAKSFGVKVEPLGDLRQKIGMESIDYYSSDSGKSVYELRNKHNFFHWELEFPDLFYDDEGNKKSNPGFDIIIGNPPWSSKLAKAETKILAEKIGWDQKNLNVCALFIAESLNKLSKDGILGFLLPKVLVKNMAYLPVRKKILENYFIKKIGDFGQFPGVASDAVSLIIQNAKKQKETEITFFNEAQVERQNFIDSDIFKLNSSYIFSLSLTPEIQKLLDKIKENSRQLIEICDIKRGIEVGQQSNIVKCENCGCYNEADIKYYSPSIKKCKNCQSTLNLQKKSPISSLQKSKKYIRKCISGTQLHKYKIIGNYFIPESLDGISYKEEAFNGKKILLKRISTKIEGTFTNVDLLAFNTVYSVYKKDLNRNELLFILAILNSKLMNFFYEYSYNVGMSLTTQVTKDFLKTVPIKYLQDNTVKEKLAELVMKLLDLNKKSTETSDNVNIQKEIIKTAEMTEKLVYDIYFINNKEKELIENSI